LRIIIADPALTDHTGHYLNYAMALKEEFARRGHDVALIGNQKVAPDLRAEHGILPGFSLGFYEAEATGIRQLHPSGASPCQKVVNSLINVFARRQRWRQRLRANVVRSILVRRTTKDLRSIDADMKFRGGDLVILNSVNALAAMGIARWLVGLPRGRRPTVVLILHFAPTSGPAGHSSAEAVWRRFFVYSRAAGISEQLRICADSTELVNGFARIGDLPVSVLPIPHPTPDGAGASKAPSRHPIVLFIGVATKVKGFHLLPDIVKAAAETIGPGKISFCVQINVPDGSPEMEETTFALRALDITRMEGPLKGPAYYDAFRAADILLQPCDPGYYATQTSGVFADGRVAGLVSIVPAGTTMAREILRGGGGVVVAERSAAAYVEGLRRALEDFDRHVSAAHVAAQSWTKANSAVAFTDTLNRILPATHQI
jgi:glycosyltransferase involved in cell wall biosynthesis